MPLFFVNEHLIQEELRGEGRWENTEETYKRFMIKTAPGAVKRMPDGSYEPIDRIICTHNCSIDPTAKSRITSTVREGEEKPPRVGVKTSIDTRYDTDAFVVAIPYEGIIMPVKADPKALAIFKTLVLRSDRMTIEHEDGKYMRCLYLVLRPHHDYLDAATEWYKDDCNLTVSFIHSNKAKNDPVTENTRWIIHTVTVRFGTDGKFEILVKEDEEMPYDSINLDDIRNAPFCQTVEPTVITQNRPAQQNTRRPSTNTPKYEDKEEYSSDKGYGGGKNTGRRNARNRRGR